MRRTCAQERHLSIPRAWLATAAVVLVCAAATPVRADPGAGAGSKPWYKDTTREQRQRAREIFLEGNRLLHVPSFARAAATYRRAIEMWGHPAFYYNLVIAQLSLVQPIEAYASIKQALRYGPEALGHEKHQQALRYKWRLEQQLARVTIRCGERGAEVTLDGKVIFIGPGQREQVVLPGTHQVVASKPGKITETRSVVLSPGEQTEVTLAPGIPDRIETRRHVPAWIPWVGLGAGAAVLSAAGYLDRDASRKLARFDRDFNGLCRRGCTDDEVPELTARLRSADRQKRTALGLYVAGGAVALGSAIFIYVNRERIVRTRAEREELSVTPLIAPRANGVVARWTF